MDEIEKTLEKGGAVVLPTETVYGLFGKALNQQTVEYIYQLKRRPQDKAMNLNVAHFEDILYYSKNQPSYLKKICQSFLPGPLTIILQANAKVPTWVNSGMNTVGFRIPSHPITLNMIRRFGPLIGPSANISGRDSGTCFEQIVAAFHQKVIGVEDDHFLTGKDSTILDLSGDKAVILRQGLITVEDILAQVPEITF
ncbi:MAG: L-threonylcarbamoyladenylate synthase [Streptococcus sp.]|nr:L-threonylcarbamoyladenylate synthase [Streptococcus sp.]